MSLTNLKAITVVVAAIAALIAVRWVYFKILCIAKDKNLVDNPDARKLQKTPIPVMGGIAVFFGVAFGIMAGYTAGGMLGGGRVVNGNQKCSDFGNSECSIFGIKTTVLLASAVQ